MATYVNNLRLKEITTGDESGTWGTSTNTNLELIGEALGYGTKQVAADSNETFTMPNATADGTRALYLKFTSAGSLTATRTLTLLPNTVSKMWMIENATTGSQSITIKQGGGAEVTIVTGAKAWVYTDGAGAGAAVTLANPTETGTGTVTSVAVTGTVNGISLTGGPVTSTGTFTLGGTLANVNLTTQVTGTLPIGNGGTNSTSTTYCSLTANVSGTLPVGNGGTGSTATTFVNLTSNVTGTLPVANGGTGITSLATGIATWWGTPSSANLRSVVTDETGTGSLVFATSPTLVTPALGTPASGILSGCTVDGSDAVGFKNIPQNSKSADYTVVLADSGKHIFHPSGDASTRTYTIPANASVAYPIGTAVVFVNMTSQVVSIAITSDIMYLAKDGTTGTRSLAQYGSATALKMTATTWLISGSALS